MKVFGIFLIIAFITLLAMKMIEYFRYIKLHHKQVAQLGELIIELKAKQKILNERAKIMDDSEVYQHNRINIIYSSIYKTIDKITTK
jgi:hypothetical protein